MYEVFKESIKIKIENKQHLPKSPNLKKKKKKRNKEGDLERESSIMKHSICKHKHLSSRLT